jgi:hypothetical protein
MMFVDWQFVAEDDEYLRNQYGRTFILVDAMYRDVPMMSRPYIYANDAALAFGWTRGAMRQCGSSNRFTAQYECCQASLPLG